MKKLTFLLVGFILVSGLIIGGTRSTAFAQEAEDNSRLELLGKAIFFDADLSVNGTQSCATCHAPEVGWTGPDALVNLETVVYQGALPHRFGNRKPPASAYAGDSPVFYFD
jgi:cytochrome c peroxidase